MVSVYAAELAAINYDSDITDIIYLCYKSPVLFQPTVIKSPIITVLSIFVNNEQ